MENSMENMQTELRYKSAEWIPVNTNIHLQKSSKFWAYFDGKILSSNLDPPVQKDGLLIHILGFRDSVELFGA